MKFRIKKEPLGFIVEVAEPKWTIFGIRWHWVPYVKSAGLEMAWHHCTAEYAIMNLIDQVKEDTIISKIK